MITAVGTAGAAGTGVTLTAPLTGAHANGVAGSGPRQRHHPDLGALERAPGAEPRDRHLGARHGITLTAPLTQAHAAGSTVNGPATGLISDSPQGQIIGVLNNDQDGLNYPAHKWGTGYYMNNLLDGQAGPWFNNINATPVSAGAEQRLRHRRDPAAAAQPARRAGVPHLVGERRHAGAAATWAQKYNYSIPLENPLHVQEHGLGAGQPGHPARCRRTCRRIRRSTRRCSTTAPAAPTRCRSASAASRRWATSASTTRAPTRSSAAHDNPYPAELPEQADPVRRVRAGLEQRLLLEPQLLGLRHGARAGRLRQAVRGPAARRRVHRDVVLVRDRLAAGGRRGRRSRTARSPTSR